MERILGIGRNGHIGFNEPSENFSFKIENQMYFLKTKIKCLYTHLQWVWQLYLRFKAKNIILLVNGRSKMML